MKKLALFSQMQNNHRLKKTDLQSVTKLVARSVPHPPVSMLSIKNTNNITKI